LQMIVLCQQWPHWLFDNFLNRILRRSA
jgi:hypothetical protein